MLAIRIALRYLFSRKSHAAVNIISYVAMAGVAIASAALIIVMSVFNGFSDFAHRKMARLTPDIYVSAAAGKVIGDADSVAVEIMGVGDVEGVSPVIDEQAFATAGDRQLPLKIRGVDPSSDMIAAYDDLLVDGDMYLADEDGFTTGVASIGVAYSLQMTSSAPMTVRIYEPRRLGRLNPANPAAGFKVDSVTVAGVYRVDQKEYDEDMLIVPLSMARRLLNYDTEASALYVSLRRGADLSEAARAISARLGEGYVVRTRPEQQEHTFRMISIEKWVTMLMLVFILVIASFNIISTMSMLIVDKRPNRAILLAMGATRGMIASVFAWVCFLISSIGGLIGIVGGLALSFAQQYGGFIKLNVSDVSALAIQVYPVRVSALDVVIVLAVTVGIGLLTSMLIRAVNR